MRKLLAFILSFSVFMGGLSARAEEYSPSAAAAIVVNGETGGVIYGKNETQRLPMASTTKIMTALLLCENCDLEQEVKTTREMVTVEGSSMGLLEGDTVSYKALLYGMMLPSGNDAATTAAISIAGSLEEFALMMNAKARELGMNNTNFVTPSGLDAEKHYTCAEDMAKLTVYALKNEAFRTAVKTKSIRLEYGNPPYSRTIFGHNKMLDLYEGAIGVKTGYTSKSGKCLVSAASKGSKTVIAVTLRDSSTWSNHKRLLDLGFEKLIEKRLELPEMLKKIEVVSGEEKAVETFISEEVVALTAEEIEALRFEASKKPFAYAPIEKGEKIGKIEFLIGEKPLRKYEIKAVKGIKLKKQKQKSFSERYIAYLQKMIYI